MPQSVNFYQDKTESLNESVRKVSAEVYRLSWARVILFLISVTAFIYFANARNGFAMFLVLVIFVILFGWLIHYFNRRSDLLGFMKQQRDMCAEEIARYNLTLEDLDGGNEFIDRQHPYSYDLDIFGKHSLFKLINRTCTPDGRIKMRDWMLSPARPETISTRQEAVLDLRKNPSWLLDFLSSARSATGSSVQIEQLKNWVKEKESGSAGSVMRVFSIAGPLLLIGALLMIILFNWTIYILAPFLIINGILLSRIQNELKELNEKTSGNVRLLRSYESMIRHLISGEFSSDRMRILTAPFGERSLEAIRSLRRLLDYMDGRSNMFYAVFNLVFLLDVHILAGMTKWKMNNEEDIDLWFDHMAEAEVLSSLAAHAFLHPEYTMPEVGSHWTLSATEMGHPLIGRDEVVTNSFDLSGKGTVAIVTGSNMSGKSTFLRTVGINTILGLMGSVVYSKQMVIPVVQLFTGMRTEDDLSNHVSSFYAELKRIRQMLDLIQSSQVPVLFMLDEILKGTNTEDRHRGSEGLVNQLSRSDSFGFVSTHDLEIGKLSETNDRIRNFSFNSRIEGDKIIFDYKIEKGICHSFNASKLMELMGIQLPE